MTALLATRPSLDLPDHVFAGDDAAALGVILLPHMNLAIWARRGAPAVPDGDDLDAVDDIGVTIDLARAAAQVRGALAAAGYADAPVRALGRDIAALATRFGDLIDCRRVAIRLEVVETDACRRFHADHVGVRLICTYAGPGTQWLSQEDAARLQEGTGVDLLNVRTVSTGHVGVFKGREWSPDRAIVHRSPPIAGTGGRRLVLVIDVAADRAIPHH